MSWSSGCWLLAAAVLLSCGGKAFVDPVGFGGAGGTEITTSSSGSSGSSTSSSSSGCGPAVCPAEPPAAGSACECEAGLQCGYDLCGISGELQSALCDGSSWQIDSEPCATAWCPNGIPCLLGEVCLVTSTGFEASFECVANPCAPQLLDCSCAAVLCDAEESFECVSTTSDQVLCECTIC